MQFCGNQPLLSNIDDNVALYTPLALLRHQTAVDSHAQAYNALLLQSPRLPSLGMTIEYGIQRPTAPIPSVAFSRNDEVDS